MSLVAYGTTCFFCSLHLVSSQQRNYCAILVWNTIQSYVHAMDSIGLQHDYPWRVSCNTFFTFVEAKSFRHGWTQISVPRSYKEEAENNLSEDSNSFNLIVSSGFVEIIGILVGHMYYFLKYRYPVDYGGTDFLQTPKFFYDFLPNSQGTISGFGAPPAYRYNQRDAAPPNPERHNWGRGNLLGGQ